MDKAMGRMVLVGGTALYVAMGVLALMTYMWNVEFFSFVTLGIALQIAVALPVVAALLGRMKIPTVSYVKWLLALTVALSASGALGVPSGSSRIFPAVDSLKAKAEAIEADDLGGREKLELAIELAELNSDDEDGQQVIKDKIAKVDDSISKKDRKEAKREIAVLRAKARLAAVGGEARQMAIFSAEKRSGLMLLAAFIMFAGAWMLSRHDD